MQTAGGTKGVHLDTVLGLTTEEAAAEPPGSTGNLPVPRGDQPRGTEERVEKFQT